MGRDKMKNVSSAIRKAAKGENCTLRLPGICNFNPDTTVACHSPWLRDGMGKGTKSDDLSVAF